MAAQEDSMPVPEMPKIFVERTLAIIKPDAVHKFEEIKDIILRTGFSILSVSTFISFSWILWVFEYTNSYVVIFTFLSHLWLCLGNETPGAILANELNKNNFLSKNLLFYVIKPILLNDWSEALYKNSR